MRELLVRELKRYHVLTRRQALELVSVDVLKDAVTDGVLVRLLPEVYTLPSKRNELPVRRLGALAYRENTALSHLDGLDVWEVLPDPRWLGRNVHLTAERSVPHLHWPGYELHRPRGFVAAAPQVVMRRGMRVVPVEQAIVESWTLLPRLDQRIPSIVAIREGKTDGDRLLATLAGNSRAAGAAEMRHVFGLVATGCHSPLELWGHEHVFSHPSLPVSRCQVPQLITTGNIYLDRYYEEEKLNVELDGAAYHGEPGQRERDNRRDAALAALGIQVVRFSHLRLHADPDGVRAQTLEILRMRRRQFGLPVSW